MGRGGSGPNEFPFGYPQGQLISLALSCSARPALPPFPSFPIRLHSQRPGQFYTKMMRFDLRSCESEGDPGSSVLLIIDTRVSDASTDRPSVAAPRSCGRQNRHGRTDDKKRAILSNHRFTRCFGGCVGSAAVPRIVAWQSVISHVRRRRRRTVG